MGLEFNLEREDLKLEPVCPVLGIKMCFVGSKRTEESYSLDRIDNSKGYIKGNVRIISWKANRLKNNGSIEDFEKIIKYIKENTNGII